MLNALLQKYSGFLQVELGQIFGRTKKGATGGSLSFYCCLAALSRIVTGIAAVIFVVVGARGAVRVNIGSYGTAVIIVVSSRILRGWETVIAWRIIAIVTVWRLIRE
jgi:hypothetical protein